MKSTWSSTSSYRSLARVRFGNSTVALGGLLVLLLIGGVALSQATGPVQDTPRTGERDATEPTETPAAAALQFDVVAGDTEYRINRLIEQMTLREKIGQLVQVYPNDDPLNEELAAQIRNGDVGSIFYPGNAAVVQEAQRIALNESRLGIPLIIARDVVHGFRTIFPIPLGQAASWNPELVEQAAMVAAQEAKSEGIDWTFAPMLDVCRDPRWGRVAETLGEDPKLTSDLAAAMVRGFQQEGDDGLRGLAACAKHFVAYGLSEGGRDYARASLSQADLHNIHLPPFKASVQAGCRTLMTTFSEVNGVPGTAHRELIEGVLKGDWNFGGLVVSDWGSIVEMVAHGFSPDNAGAAQAAMLAGVDMDMCSPAYSDHMLQHIKSGIVSEERLDDAVRRVLRLKVELQSVGDSNTAKSLLTPDSLELAREAARQSLVLLKNDNVLPLQMGNLDKVAIIGPLSDEPQQQLGCWVLDGKPADSITPLKDLQSRLAGNAQVVYERGAASSFSSDESGIAKAVEAARGADVALLFVGEDAVLSGEARSRAHLSMPGVQPKLVEEVAATGTPTVVVVLAGRPLAIQGCVAAADAVLYAWHPGTMAGPAITDVLFGEVSPSGKLPITFPRAAGQIPIYYSRHNTGRPAPDNYAPLIGSGLDDLPEQYQYRSHYLDVDPNPLFPFGYGLSYAEFKYSDLELSTSAIKPDQVLGVRVTLANTGDTAATEVSQLYVRDRAARMVRPIRELKAYRRTTLDAGESTVLEFAIPAQELGYYDNRKQYVLEPGQYDVWVGADSTATLGAEFRLVDENRSSIRQDLASPRFEGDSSRQ